MTYVRTYVYESVLWRHIPRYSNWCYNINSRLHDAVAAREQERELQKTAWTMCTMCCSCMSRRLCMGDADMLVRHVMVVGPHNVRTPIGGIKLGHQGIHLFVLANPMGSGRQVSHQRAHQLITQSKLNQPIHNVYQSKPAHVSLGKSSRGIAPCAPFQALFQVTVADHSTR